MSEKLQQVFASALQIDPSLVVDTLRYAETPAWDSVAHMSLVAAIEEAFGIMIDAEDVIDMNSFEAAKRIVAKYS
jgi:acyl carrier protein